MQLANWTTDPETLTMLQSASYWQIRGLDEGTPRPWPLITAEIELQAGVLGGLLEDLRRRVAQASDGIGDPAVLDTNVLLEYLPIDAISWVDVLDSRPVRLLIPLRVIEELDAKKYSGRPDLAKRARRILPQLESLLRADRHRARADTRAPGRGARRSALDPQPGTCGSSPVGYRALPFGYRDRRARTCRARVRPAWRSRLRARRLQHEPVLQPWRQSGGLEDPRGRALRVGRDVQRSWAWARSVGRPAAERCPALAACPLTGSQCRH